KRDSTTGSPPLTDGGSRKASSTPNPCRYFVHKGQPQPCPSGVTADDSSMRFDGSAASSPDNSLDRLLSPLAEYRAYRWANTPLASRRPLPLQTITALPLLSIAAEEYRWSPRVVVLTWNDVPSATPAELYCRA